MVGYEYRIILILNGVFETKVIFEFNEVDRSFNNFGSIVLRVHISLLFERVILFLLIKLVMYVPFSLLVLKLVGFSLCFDLCNYFIKRVIHAISFF